MFTEFYDECMKFIEESLSNENVCRFYQFALYHDTTLMGKCEEAIKSNFHEIIKTCGFITSNQVMLSKMLPLAPSNAQPTEIFDACISWAKKYCIKNKKNATNNEHLRNALDDL